MLLFFIYSEDYVQETILGAWDISTHTKVYKFYCSNCDKVLQHTNKIREAKLSPETLNKAIDYLNRCLSLLTRGVYLSMYEQTLSEVTFAHDIQVFVASERSSQSHLKAALDMVFDVLREASHSNTAQTLSGNTTAFLRRTALALARLLQALDPSDATDRYLQGRLAEVSEGFSWGAALFNFDGFLEQIVRGDWLNTTLAKMMVVAGGGTGGGDCSVDESQALHLFARVPWAGIDKFSEDELHTFVLGSLEKFLRNALEKGLAKLGVLCAEVAVYACNLYPNLTKKVVSMLTTATLPNAKIALTSVLPFLPFNSLSYKHLCSVYSKM